MLYRAVLEYGRHREKERIWGMRERKKPIIFFAICKGGFFTMTTNVGGIFPSDHTTNIPWAVDRVIFSSGPLIPEMYFKGYSMIKRLRKEDLEGHSASAQEETCYSIGMIISMVKLSLAIFKYKLCSCYLCLCDLSEHLSILCVVSFPAKPPLV